METSGIVYRLTTLVILSTTIQKVPDRTQIEAITLNLKCISFFVLCCP